MKLFKIECEWEMPEACGTFKTREKAEEAINNEDWESYTEMTLEEVLEDGIVRIVELDVK